jgi:nucleoside 2-deoxyribosyltransferase
MNREQFLLQALELLRQKSGDYSKDNITATELAGIAVRLYDKVTRFKNLTFQNRTPIFEDVEELLKDILNYTLISAELSSGEWGQSTNLVYLGGSIDAITHEQASGWREEVTKSFNEYGISVYNPVGAFGFAGMGAAQAISTINRQAILACDFCLFRVDKASFGTIREIEFAKANGKPLVVVSAHLSSHVESHDLHIVASLDEAISFIVGLLPKTNATRN